MSDAPGLTGFAMNKLDRRGAFPRWRARPGRTDIPLYVFAAPFKKTPNWLVIRPSDSWGLMSDEEFIADYMPSNKDSRETLEAIAVRRPEIGDMAKAYLA